MRYPGKLAKALTDWVHGLINKPKPVPTFYPDGSFQWVSPPR